MLPDAFASGNRSLSAVDDPRLNEVLHWPDQPPEPTSAGTSEPIAPAEPGRLSQPVASAEPLPTEPTPTAAARPLVIQRFTDNREPIVGSVGGRIKLTCIPAFLSPKPTIGWFKDGQPLKVSYACPAMSRFYFIWLRRSNAADLGNQLIFTGLTGWPMRGWRLDSSLDRDLPNWVTPS